MATRDIFCCFSFQFGWVSVWRGKSIEGALIVAVFVLLSQIAYLRSEQIKVIKTDGDSISEISRLRSSHSRSCVASLSPCESRAAVNLYLNSGGGGV